MSYAQNICDIYFCMCYAAVGIKTRPAAAKGKIMILFHSFKYENYFEVI